MAASNPDRLLAAAQHEERSRLLSRCWPRNIWKSLFRFPLLVLVLAVVASAQQTDTRAAADEAYAEAVRLSAQKTPEAMLQAIAKAEQALNLYRQLGDRARQAELLIALGSTHEAGREPTPARDAYQQALPLCREEKNRQCEVAALMGLARIAFASGERTAALDDFGQALPLWRALGDRLNQASTLYMLGITNELLSQPRAAIPHYLEALTLYRDLGNRAWEARTLNNLADAYAALGEDAQAGAYYDQAIPALHAIGDKSKEGTARIERSRLRESAGEMAQATGDLTAALELFRDLGDQLMQATVLLRLGIVHYEMGDPERSLQFDQQALKLARALQERGLEAAALSGISSVYLALGDDPRALSFSDEAFKLMARTEDRADPDALYRLGVSYQSLGKSDKARECFARAAALQQARGDGPGQARSLHALAGIYDVAGEPRQALKFYQQALEIRQRTGDRRARAQALTALATVEAELAQYDHALPRYREALALYRAVHDPVGESQALYWTAKSEQAAGQLESARSHMEASLAIIESQRARISSRELRTTYLGTVQHGYGLYVDVLMQLHRSHPDRGYDARAFEAHERGKARGLLDLLNEARINFRQGVPADLLQREEGLRQRLEEKQSAEIRLLAGGESGEPVHSLQRELDALRLEHQQVEAQLRGGSPRYAALTQPQPLSVAAVQQLLDSDTVLLEFALGEPRSYLWAVTPTTLSSFELAGRGELEKLAVRWYRAIIGRRPSGEDGLRTTSASLSRLLLAQVQDRIAGKRLLIAADGALQIVPFAALPTPGADSDEPLVVGHEIVSIPSASTLALIRRDAAGRPAAAKKLAVFADAVFERKDERLAASAAERSPQAGASRSLQIEDPAGESFTIAASSGLRFQRLSFSREEAEAILRLAPQESRMAALGFAANRANATSPTLGQFQIIHFATHGVVNDAHPELSGIVLSLFDTDGKPQDGFLRLDDLFNLRLNADLVVLSACQTALGREVRGEGLMGLARGFMYAGAPRVVVSLWSVSDQATSEEMQRFYNFMLGKRHLRPAAALRQAQIEMWKQERWRAPVLWAAFVLQGDWR